MFYLKFLWDKKCNIEQKEKEKEEKSVSPEVLTGHESWTWSPACATNSSTSAAKSFRQEIIVRDIKIVNNIRA